MRSNVAEPTYSSPIFDVRDQRSHPLNEPRLPNAQHPRPQPTAKKSRLVLAPKEGWLAMLLLAAAAFCVDYSIGAVGWVSHTFILYWSAAAGLCIGLVIAKMHRLPQPILHLAACLSGHWLSIWLTSVIAYHASWGLLIAGIGAVLTDPTRINNSEMVFLFYLCFLSFFLGYFGAWLLYRAHLPWLVALVYCSILLINLNYVKQDLSYVVAILLAVLILLIARMQLTIKLEYWKSQGLYADRSWLRGITMRFIQVSSVMLVITLLLGWALPVLGQPGAGATAWNNLDNAWSNITHGHLSLENPGSILQPYQSLTNFFGDQLTIAGSVHLPAGEVLDYTSSTAAPQYLAGFSYDHFDGHTWTSSDQGSAQNYDANAMLPNDANVNYKSVTTSVTIVQPPGGTKHYLFGPTQPSAFDVATTLYGNPFVSVWSQQSALTKGEHYQVTSFVSTAAPHDLSAVPFPQDHPDFWNNDTNFTPLQMFYLQVPVNISGQVLVTAQQWTQGATGTYDALKMLEARLSNTAQFTYSLDNPSIPDNVDAVSWLLQTPQGYCTYYATAMTIMARLLRFEEMVAPRIVTKNTHGTGCTFASAIATFLARGDTVYEAVRKAKTFITLAIESNLNLGKGHGPTNPSAYVFREMERYQVIQKLKRAMEVLKEEKVGPLIPEVSSNLGYALPFAEGVEDVAAFPGRIVRFRDSVTTHSDAEFGASQHVANIILTVMKFDLEYCSAMNIRYSRETVALFRREGFLAGHFDRRLEPKKVKEREGSSWEWGVEQVLRKMKRVPDLIYDEGDVGKEPMIRVLGKNPMEVVQKILKAVGRKQSK